MKQSHDFKNATVTINIDDGIHYWQEAVRHREAIERQFPEAAHHISKMWMNLSEFVPDVCKLKENDMIA